MSGGRSSRHQGPGTKRELFSSHVNNNHDQGPGAKKGENQVGRVEIKRQQLLIDKWVLRKRISEERRTWNDDEQPGSLFSGVEAFPNSKNLCNVLGCITGCICVCSCLL